MEIKYIYSLLEKYGYKYSVGNDSIEVDIFSRCYITIIFFDNKPISYSVRFKPKGIFKKQGSFESFEKALLRYFRQTIAYIILGVSFLIPFYLDTSQDRQGLMLPPTVFFIFSLILSIEPIYYLYKIKQLKKILQLP